MRESAPFASVRLAIAGYVSLALLAWIGFVPGSTPAIFRFSPVHPVHVLVTVALALFILVNLVPVFWRGPVRTRCLAGVLAFFPAITLGITGLCLIPRGH